MPNTQDRPSSLAEFSIDLFVALVVALQFSFPIRTIACWNGAVLWTAVPEAAIDKHCEPCLPKYKIGTPANWLMPPPASKAILAEEANHRHLGLKVSF